jgi:LPS O-antigen subunit length determinant protein (WzzB/FepE family)
MAERKIPVPKQSASYRDTTLEDFPPVMYADLPLLARVIFRRKFVFGAFLAISVLLWLAYWLTQPSIFRSEVQFSQPEVQTYPLLTDIALKELRLLPRELFFEYKNNLSSRANQQNFLTRNATKYFPNNPSISHFNVESNDVSDEIVGRFRSIKRTWSMESKKQPIFLHSLFSELLRIEVSSDLPERHFFYLAVEFPKAEIAARIANDYTDHVNKLTIDEVETRIRQQIHKRRESIQKEISHKLKVARLERENLIVQLEEQALISESVEWEVSNETKVKPIELMPLYFRGAKVLRAHAEILTKRSDDRPFVPEIALLESELEHLNTVPDELFIAQAAYVTRSAYPATSPNNNHFFFSLVIALGLGLVTSAIYNIFSYYLKN